MFLYLVISLHDFQVYTQYSCWNKYVLYKGGIRSLSIEVGNNHDNYKLDIIIMA